MSEPLSPGIAYGCFELLSILEEKPMQLSAARSLGKLGVVTASRVTDCILLLGWAEKSDAGLLDISLRGKAVRNMPLTEQRLRQALLDIVDATNPPWAQNARFGRRRVLQYAPPEIAQICSEAGLSNGDDLEVVLFWDTLASRARGIRDVHLSEIGRQGERLTIQYEKKRTLCAPRWIALESNEDGYDILSTMSSEDNARLCIEVKTSQQGLLGNMHITRHEWDTAQILLNYKLYLWDLSARTPRLAVLDIDTLSSHLPSDQNHGQWQSTSIPFQAFSNCFTAIPDLMRPD